MFQINESSVQQAATQMNIELSKQEAMLKQESQKQIKAEMAKIKKK